MTASLMGSFSEAKAVATAPVLSTHLQSTTPRLTRLQLALMVGGAAVLLPACPQQLHWYQPWYQVAPEPVLGASAIALRHTICPVATVVSAVPLLAHGPPPLWVKVSALLGLVQYRP